VCKEGYWETFFENGNLASKCTYENGWIIGVYEEYYENGQVKLIANFDKKDRIGRWEYFYDNGRKKKEVSFVDNEGTILNFWLSDGEQTLEKGNGALYEVIDDGDSIVQEFMDYQLHGRYFVFRRRMDNNDRYGIDSEYHYKNGLENGTRKHYGVYADTDEERLSFTMEFKEGKRDGYWVRYFRFDTVAISFFIDDLEHGTSAVYHENSGSLESKETWRMGVRHGIRKYYTYSGRPKKYQYIWEDDIVGHETIEKGEIVSTYIPSGDTSLFYKAKKLFK
jgi:antitoxin component YwqK of YwqJK toxin-antitoxin module